MWPFSCFVKYDVFDVIKRATKSLILQNKRLYPQTASRAQAEGEEQQTEVDRGAPVHSGYAA